MNEFNCWKCPQCGLMTGEEEDYAHMKCAICGLCWDRLQGYSWLGFDRETGKFAEYGNSLIRVKTWR